MGSKVGLLLAYVLVAAAPALPQASLSANSGIDVTDSYAVVDVTVQGGSASLGILPDQALHVEVGYDSSQGPVMNVYMYNSGDPSVTSVNDVSVIRYAGGELVPFDAQGNRVSIALPNGQPFTTSGLSRLAAGGQTLLGALVVPSLDRYVQAHGSSVFVNGPTAQISRNAASGTGLTYSYAQRDAGWALQALQIVESTSQGPLSKTLQFSNLVYSQNVSKDAQRQAYGRRSTAINPPNSNPIPGTLSQDNGNDGTYTLQNHGGTQNVVFQHGLFSSGSTWGRMDGWLNQDFSFGNVLTPSLPTTQSLSSQGKTLSQMIQTVGGNQYILIGHSQGGPDLALCRSIFPEPWTGPYNGSRRSDNEHSAFRRGFDADGSGRDRQGRI